MRRRRPRRPQKGTYKRKPYQYKVACSVCGAEHVVPVAPPTDKDLTCLNCLKGIKEHNNGDKSAVPALSPDSQNAKGEISK